MIPIAVTTARYCAFFNRCGTQEPKFQSHNLSDLLGFFRVYPGLRQFIGGIILRYCKAPLPPVAVKEEEKTEEEDTDCDAEDLYAVDFLEFGVMKDGGHESKVNQQNQSSVCLVM